MAGVWCCRQNKIEQLIFAHLSFSSSSFANAPQNAGHSLLTSHPLPQPPQVYPHHHCQAQSDHQKPVLLSSSFSSPLAGSAYAYLLLLLRRTPTLPSSSSSIASPGTAKKDVFTCRPYSRAIARSWRTTECPPPFPHPPQAPPKQI